MADGGFQVVANNPKAEFTLKLHRGDGMTLLAMDWKQGRPPKEFVGFAIEYQEPEGPRFFVVRNRLTFPGIDAKKDPNATQTLRSPIQKFRWIHFPRNADLEGEFTYRVTPAFMNPKHELSYGEAQTAKIRLARDTYPNLNVTFTRGFVSSQAFVDRYLEFGPIKTLLPAKADDGLRFQPTHPKTADALAWMGFEARDAILDVLDEALADTTAKVRVVAYELSEPVLVGKLAKLGKRLEIVIDDSAKHDEAVSAESQAAGLLGKAGAAVKRQHMGQLQHNKTIVVDGKVNKVVCGSTNFTWRGFFVQSNNAVVLHGATPVKVFTAAFRTYFDHGTTDEFRDSPSATWHDLGVAGIEARVTFSPHSKTNAMLASIAADVATNTTSSLLYSLAFLYQTPGPMLDAIAKHTKGTKVFVYGISDRKVGIDVQTPSGNVAPVFPSELAPKTVPEPFKSEPTGGGGVRMHHKFLVLDFDKPTARVYLGSYNFSDTADQKNGENLLMIEDRRVATSYAVEALSLFDHYHFRVAQKDAKKRKKKLELSFPPKPGEKAWFEEDWEDAHKKRDRELFA